MKKRTVVKCPTCGKEVAWDKESPWRPFCSERCRLIDLGAWADGSHAIPGETTELPPDQQPDENGTSH